LSACIRGASLFRYDHAGNVVALHYRLKDESWRYYPQGAKVHPLVIGKLVPGDTVYVFESYWDAFAFMDKFGKYRHHHHAAQATARSLRRLYHKTRGLSLDAE
jgi:hypothetical protein